MRLSQSTRVEAPREASGAPRKRFIREIRRRSLWQVLGIYLLASWAVLGGVDTLGDVLGLPDWFPPFALALLIVGLPVVLAIAFIQEGGRGHYKEYAEADRSGPENEPVDQTVPSRLFTWHNALLGGLGALALVGDTKSSTPGRSRPGVVPELRQSAR